MFLGSPEKENVNGLGMFMNIYFKTAVNVGMIWSTIIVKTSEFYGFSRFVSSLHTQI